MFDGKKCNFKVFDGWHYHPCSRNEWKDGYCKQHHPDSVAKRQQEAKARYEAKRKVDPYYQYFQVRDMLNGLITKLETPDCNMSCKEIVEELKKILGG